MSDSTGPATPPPVDNSQLPPFGGYRPPPPPPGTSGYATRFGLVRPYRDRYLAGVCGAFARATNTDPVLWRVLLPVAMLAGGLGSVVYLLGWLLIPAEGDTGSPIEALAGRGRSSMGRPLTIVLTVIASIAIISPLSSGFGGGRFFIVGLLLAVVALVVASRNSTPVGGSRSPWWSSPVGAPPPSATMSGWPAGAAPSAVPTGPGDGLQDDMSLTDEVAGEPGAAGDGTTDVAASGGAMPGGPVTGFGPKPAGAEPVPAGWSTTGVPGSTGWTPTTSVPYAVPPGPTTGARIPGGGPTYRPPFAPHGPFAPGSDDDFAFPGLAGPPVLPPPPPPPPVRRERKPPSPARRITLSAMLVVLGVMVVLDASNAVSIPAAGYFAVALGTVGLGLFIGAFAGKPRGLIGIGILLSLGLIASSAIGSYHDRYAGGELNVKPTSVAEIEPSYSLPVGKMVIDLTQVKFPANTPIHLTLRLHVGDMQVILPRGVDAEVFSSVNLGSSDLLGRHSGGVNPGRTHITDDGTDGPGGGSLIIDAHVNVGRVEVNR